MSIQEGLGRIKGFLDRGLKQWGIPLMVIFFFFSSFGLGRLSSLEENRPAVSVSQAPKNSEIRAISLGGEVVASRSGTSYHFPWCPGAQTMKEGNKVWFKDESAAQKAGYKPAGNCKGLSQD